VGTEVVTGSRDDHIKLVIDGVPGSAMQAFGKQLDAAQLAAVVHYERHAWGNDAGDITQPKDVLELAGQ
jgi:cytochrome c oxidase subunit 2